MPTGILGVNLGDTVSFRTVTRSYNGKVIRIIPALSEPTAHDLENFYKIDERHIAYQEVVQPIACDRIVIDLGERILILFRDYTLNPDIIAFKVDSHDFTLLEAV